MNEQPASPPAASQPDPSQPSNSLMVRTSLALAVAFAVAALGLILVFRPYLATAFQRESGELLDDQERRARDAARVDTDVTETLLRSSVQATWKRAEDAVADAPLDLVTEDEAAVRAILAEELERLSRESNANLAAVTPELRLRAEARMRTALENVAARNARRSEEFAVELAAKAAALLLALLAIVFLIHGGLLYRRVLAPVRRLSAATRRVAAGDLETRIPIEGDDEVARLGTSFNAMTTSLAAALEELRTLNATLEDRVKDQTAALREALADARSANRRLEAALEELRSKERELRHAEKMASLGTLAGGVAHEFNNLLGGILGCAEDAQHEEDRVELRETLSVIERTARRGTAITGNLLRFARPSAGDPEDVDVGQIARDVAALVEPEAARRGVTVRVLGEEHVALHTDPSSLHQVLLNLAANGLYAMDSGGELRLSVEASDGWVQIDVEDDGTGIDPAVLERLFEPFFTTRGPSGTGLGLSVSYGIVRAQGGRIEVESEPGRGSRFRVVLPAGTGHDATAAPPHETVRETTEDSAEGAVDA